jgi:hypothetical protein
MCKKQEHKDKNILKEQCSSHSTIVFDKSFTSIRRNSYYRTIQKQTTTKPFSPKQVGVG